MKYPKNMILPPDDFYYQGIMAAANVDFVEACLIESVMREQFSTFDSLTSAEFNRAARKAKKILEKDAELREIIIQSFIPPT